MKLFVFYIVVFCSAVITTCWSAEQPITPLDAVAIHIKWLNSVHNSLAVTELYDENDLLIAKNEIFTDYDLLCTVFQYTPDGSSRSIRQLSFFEYCEVHIDRAGYFKTRHKNTFDPFEDGNSNYFVRGATPAEALERLKKITKSITVKAGTGEREGQIALCLIYNDYFFEHKKHTFVSSVTGSEYESKRHIEGLSYWGEHRYWYDKESGEPRGTQLCFHPSKNRGEEPFHSEITRFLRLNIPPQESYEVIQTLMGKGEKIRFKSYGELLDNYLPIDDRKTERFSFSFIFTVIVNVIVLILIMRQCSKWLRTFF